MKKIIFGVFSVLLLNCSSIDKVNNKPVIGVDFTGNMTAEHIAFFKENYSLKRDQILVVNFKQPKSSCHFDNYGGGISKSWWTKFYSKVNLENCSNIFVYSDSHRVKKYLDNETHFEDKENFLLNNYIKRKKSCFAVMVINEKGEYLQYNGHYSENQVSKFIEALR